MGSWRERQRSLLIGSLSGINSHRLAYTLESTGYDDNVKTVYKDGRTISSAEWDEFQPVLVL